MTQSNGLKGLRSAGLALLALVAMASLGCPSPNRVRMADLHTALGNFTMSGEDPLEKEKVEYLSTGKAQYDSFFRTSAEMRAGVIVSQVFADSLSTSLKSYARNHMAAEQAGQNAAEITDEQAIEILKEKKSELTKEELAYLVKSVESAGLLTVYLGKVTTDSVSLVEQGAALATSAKSDFTGTDAARLPAVVDGVNVSQTNLKDVSEKAPELAKTITRLSEAVSSML